MGKKFGTEIGLSHKIWKFKKHNIYYLLILLKDWTKNLLLKVIYKKQRFNLIKFSINNYTSKI